MWFPWRKRSDGEAGEEDEAFLKRVRELV